MVDVMGSDEGEESTGKRENFVGEVVFSRVDCECEDCLQGREALKQVADEDDDTDTDFDHLMRIRALTEYDSEFNQFGLNVSRAWSSKWMVFTAFFENLHGPYSDNGIESLEDLADFLTDRVYEFRDITFEEDEEITWDYAGDEPHVEKLNELFEDSQFQPNSMLVPIREVTDEQELAELGVEDSAEQVEEVDF